MARKEKITPVLVFFLVVALVQFHKSPPYGEEGSEYGNPFTWIAVGQVKVKAEVVKTAEKLYLGLGYRQNLPAGRGMLFILPTLEIQVFCMRGMKFSLDILWIVDGRVARIEKNVAADFPGELISPEPVQEVLEVPAGFADRYGIKAGDRVRWR